MPEILNNADARRRFPAGLFQPAGSYRFSVDALLLAAFAAHHAKASSCFLDMGTGCGVVGLTFLLLKGNVTHGYGIDCNPELVCAAEKNAQLLGLSKYFQAETGDLADRAFLERFRETRPPVELILANPPWRLMGSGRLPTSPARRKALFGDRHTLPLFADAAAFLLPQEGLFTGIISPDRLSDLHAALLAANLFPETLRFIHNKADTPPLFALIKARKAFPAVPTLEPPLFLRDQNGFFTPESLEFCPFLR